MARVVERQDWADGLFTLRLDSRLEPFEPGQFVNVGLELDGEVVRRPYSLAAPHGSGCELFISRVEGGRLSPALGSLQQGDQVFVEPKAQGFFTLNHVPAAMQLWLMATGTGLAPFLAMLRDGGLWQRFERVVLVHGVRRLQHLAYPRELERLQVAAGGVLRRVSLVTRETPPAAEHGQPVIAGRIPAAVADGRLEAAVDTGFDPARCHVMLCGHPGMVDETLAVLATRGLRRHRQRVPGHVSVERYW